MAELQTQLSAIVIVGFCAFLLGLALTIVVAPARAERFLCSFASTAKAHYAEQGLRLLAGVAILGYAGATRSPEVFTAFGWLLVVTTLGLLVLPWRWHQKFAVLVMPPVIRRMRLFALVAAALAVGILYGLSAVSL